MSKGETCWGHDISVLDKKYKALYPSPEFQFEHPFDFSDYESSPENHNEKTLAEEHLEKFKVGIMDQHLRYPADNKTGGYSFSLESSYFSKVEKSFLELHTKINNS